MSEMAESRISVLTIVRNAPDALRRTLQSVRDQTEPPYEHLIIDGASTDSQTIQIAEEYCKEFGFAKLISEPDLGISDALNKGARNALGEHIICLNAGDCLFSAHTMQQLKLESKNLPIGSVLYGQAELIYPGYKCLKGKVNHKNLISIFSFWNPICHQSTLVARVLMTENPFREDLRYSMDLEFWLCLIKKNVTFQRSTSVFCKYEVGGISSNPQNFNAIICEHLKCYLSKGMIYKIVPASFTFLRYMVESNAQWAFQPILRALRKSRRQSHS
jgi:hypothetical protein